MLPLPLTTDLFLIASGDLRYRNRRHHPTTQPPFGLGLCAPTLLNYWHAWQKILIAFFSAVLIWGRRYLVLLRINGADAVLGWSVFEHLLKLPWRYLESYSLEVNINTRVAHNPDCLL
jgi:hypothetical protein